MLSRLRASTVQTLAAAFATFLLPANSHGQSTSQPAPGPPRKTLDQLLAESRREPIFKPDFITIQGSAASPDQVKAIEASDRLIGSAQEAALAGDFAKAAADTGEARRIREELLGPGHHSSVTASIMAATWSDVSKLADALRSDYAKTEKNQRDARVASDAGQYAEAVRLARGVVKTRTLLVGKDSPALVEPLRTVGASLTELRSWQDAEDVLQRALALSKTSFGETHPMTALVLDRLGWLQLGRGASGKALEHLESSLGVLRNTVGETIETAEVMDNLGTAVAVTGASERAERLKIRALVVRQIVAGEESKEAGISLSNLGWLYSRMGRTDDALSLRKRALAIFREKLGKKHPYTQVEMLNLAQSYSANQKYAETAELLEGPVEEDMQYKGRMTLEIVDRSTRLGMVYLRADQWEKGRKLLDRSMKLAKQMHEEGDVRSAKEALRHLLTVLQGERMLEESLAGFELLRKWDSAVKPEPKAALRRDVDLGSLYIGLGRPAEAKELLSQAVETARTLNGGEPREILAALSTLAVAYEKLSNLEEAEKAWEEVLRLTEKAVPGRTPSHAFALRNLGRIYSLLKRYDQAMFTFDDARKILDESPTADPADEVRFNWEYAECLAAQGKKADAIKHMDEAMVISKSLVEKSKLVHARALLAKTQVRYLQLLDDSAEGSRASALRAEAIDILRQLQQAKALDAEDQTALRELSKKGEPGKGGDN
jgi:tetratricopeptide (TPR) repeat protein